MPKQYEFELGKAADILTRDMLRIMPGETVVITADTESNESVVNTTAQSAYSLGAKPMVIWLATPDGVGKAADPKLPVEALGAVLTKADVWIEYNNKWLLYSTPFEVAVENNKKMRYINLVGMNPSMLVRTIGRVDIKLLSQLLQRIAEMNRKAKTIHVTTLSGTDIKFETDPDHVVSCDAGEAYEPGGIYMLPGQINVVPKFGSINGVIAFDGSLVPPCDLLDEPVKIEIADGIIKDIKGGKQSVEFRKWLESFKDENMFKVAHMAYGLNPGARLTGDIVEDERVWGCTEWGIGYVSPIDAAPGIDAKSHCDGICLNSTVWLDDEILLRNGEIVHPALKEISDKLLSS
ncbi:2,5-dihydroxypyridine 5,6-dioxygenase [Oxobacter pfennigii]|uniref:2,5-dihydroxypyridine 5,6-dioxygenase n=1 Tax=Oxobacter pfennigii TaxID=36849 RepID=A0A0P8W4U3_9CLOT|nr:hypothetical protein [Oxobacter pfennigii]KPU42550.1 2,5-dihydroxypyridine 5,6-dioxygenase [Oxobacter pfennigii]